jgi:hypothetical protein
MHLQAQPDHRHGWGAENAGNINQSSFSGRLLLSLRSRCLLSNSSGRSSALLSNWGLARQLRQELLHGGGWATTTPSWFLHRILVAFVPCSTGSEGGISCKQGNFVVNIQHRDISTRLPYSRRLTSWDVVSVTFNFLATRLRATLRGLLGSAGKLDSRLVGGS